MTELRNHKHGKGLTGMIQGMQGPGVKGSNQEMQWSWQILKWGPEHHIRESAELNQSMRLAEELDNPGPSAQ